MGSPMKGTAPDACGPRCDISKTSLQWETEDPRISPHVSRLEILGLKQLSSVSAVYQRVYLDDAGDYIRFGFKYT